MNFKSYATHIEIPVADLEKAKSFYGNIFGWDPSIFASFGPTYLLVTEAGSPQFPSFGFFQMDDIKPSLIMITMETDNIEAMLEKIESQGGKTIRQRYEVSPEIGFAAEFEDIFGNKWGLHQGRKK